jgi:DNA-binding transcriptional LysR family regulator
MSSPVKEQVMELRHLRYFVAVAEELHFARAAERLHITPPSLTQQIQVLEAELSARLLNRTKRSVELTEAGRRFLEEARKTLRQAEHTEQVGKQAGRGEIGRLEIGYMTSSACSGLVPSIIAAYRADHPRVDISLHRMETPHQLIEISEGRLDLGFVRPPDRYPIGLTGFPVYRQPVIVAMPENHPLVRLRSLTCEQLAEESFIAPSVESEIGFSGYVSAIAKQGGFTPKVSGRAPEYITIITQVAAGFGIAAVPASFARLQVPGVVYREIDVAFEARAVLSHRRGDPAPAVKSFIQGVKRMVK